MNRDITKPAGNVADAKLFDDWFDPRDGSSHEGARLQRGDDRGGV
ncbi:MAG: hypothetical protein WBF43_05620 [Methylocella sp.]